MKFITRKYLSTYKVRAHTLLSSQVHTVLKVAAGLPLIALIVIRANVVASETMYRDSAKADNRFKLPESPENNPFANISEEKILNFYEQHCMESFGSKTEVWVKAIIAPTLDLATEAQRRAEGGEDFDELIAEYFVPYFASHRKERDIGKQVDFGWVQREGLWWPAKDNSPLKWLRVGEVSKPVLNFGEGPEYAVFKVIAERTVKAASLEEVRDNIYSRLCDELAQTEMLQEVDLGSNPWCGTCRNSHNVNVQLWNLAQRYFKQGESRKAISFCLLALREERIDSRWGGPKTNEGGYYPEEQFLIEQGMDIIRYYAGVVDRVARDQAVHLPYSLPARLADMKDARAIPLLIRLVNNRGKWCKQAAYALASCKEEEALPVLKSLLTDRHVAVVEHGDAETEVVYASYYLREAARDALRIIMGLEVNEVKTLIGKASQTR